MSLVNDGGGSTLVRQELSNRPVFLKNKKVVIWEFVERDIGLGIEGWKRVPLGKLAPPNAPEPARSVKGAVIPEHSAKAASFDIPAIN